MNLRHFRDRKLLAFSGGHRAEPTGVLPPRVASDENAGLVRHRRIPRLGAVLIQCVVGRIDDRARRQIGGARASIDAVALFPVHAREWGGPDIVVNFAGDVLRGYANGKGLQYGNKIFSANETRAIVETTTVYVFPCVNPDGVEFSHTKTPMWRKNRNPAHIVPSLDSPQA